MERRNHLAKKLKLNIIEWTIDHYGFYKNPLLNLDKIDLIKKITKKSNLKINSVTADFLWKSHFGGKIIHLIILKK